LTVIVDGTNGVSTPFVTSTGSVAYTSGQTYAGALASGTAQSTASGTGFTFTGIPSYVKRITFIFNAVATSGSSQFLVRIGSGSLTTSGYASQSSYVYSAVGTTNSTAGFAVFHDSSTYTVSGNMILTNVSGNNWVSSFTGFNSTGTTYCIFGGGYVSLSGTLDRIALNTVNGTDTFNAGSVNIIYE